MRRFVVRFVLGAAVMLVARDLVQELPNPDEETVDEDWLVAGTTHALLAEALEEEPPPRTPAELEARLGDPVAPLTEADWQVAQGRARFSTRQDGIELLVLPLEDEGWRAAAALPSGPVAIDAWALFENDEVGAIELIKAKADIQSVDQLGWTALHRACFGGYHLMIVQIFTFLEIFVSNCRTGLFKRPCPPICWVPGAVQIRNR